MLEGDFLGIIYFFSRIVDKSLPLVRFSDVSPLKFNLAHNTLGRDKHMKQYVMKTVTLLLLFVWALHLLGIEGFLKVYATTTVRAISAQDSQKNCKFFEETGKSVCGRFLEYWEQHGGLAQQGYPITEQFQDYSDIDRKLYTMQYFERSIFELHPENQPPYDVLLTLLGSLAYKKLYGTVGAPNQTTSTDDPAYFTQTGQTLGGKFRTYWEQHGDVAQQGYPISNEFQERSVLNGKLYTVQYFERAVFELHSENDQPYDVLLSQLGTLRFPQAFSPDGLRHRKLRGTVIGEGKEAQPTARNGLRSYQVEEVTLPTFLTCYVARVVNGRTIEDLFTFKKFWRFTVVGDHVNTGTSNPWSIWLDETLIGASSSGDKLTTFVYDPALLREGAAIGVSYGIFLPQDTLSTRLHLNIQPTP